jgi:hypothetical protein
MCWAGIRGIHETRSSPARAPSRSSARGRPSRGRTKVARLCEIDDPRLPAPIRKPAKLCGKPHESAPSSHGKEGIAVRVRERASEVPADQRLSSSGEATDTRRGRPPSVHGPARPVPETDFLTGLRGVRVDVQRSVHRPLERERIQKSNGVFAAVVGEMSVVPVDHGDARAHEPGDREHRDSGPKREGGVGVAQVVEAANRVDPG